MNGEDTVNPAGPFLLGAGVGAVVFLIIVMVYYLSGQSGDLNNMLWAATTSALVFGFTVGGLAYVNARCLLAPDSEYCLQAKDMINQIEKINTTAQAARSIRQ
jgi:hypothetical protein